MVFFAGLAVFFAGCATPPAPAPVKPLPPRVEAADLLLRVQRSGEAFNSLVGEAKSRVETAEKKVSGQQVLMIQKPNLFRSEVLGPFGLLAQVVCDGSELVVLVPGEARAYKGEPSLQNLRRVTRLPLRLEDLVQILLYQVPLYEFVRSEVSVLSGGYGLTLTGEGGRRQVLEFDEQQRLVKASYYADRDLLLAVSYGDFSSGEPAFPRSLTLDSPVYRTTASLTYLEPRTNPSISAEKFVPAVPQGFGVVPFPE